VSVTGTGAVTLFQQTFVGPPPFGGTSSGVSARFSNPPAVANHCSSSVVGPCSVTVCNGGTSPGTATSFDSAGTLIVTGSRIDGGVEVGPFFEDNAYTAQWEEPAYQAGDVLTFSATGATVPAFSNRSIAAPSAITLTGPAAPTAGMRYPINRASPLVVSWTGGTTGEVAIQLSSAILPGPGVTVTSSTEVVCRAPASGQTLTVPAAALAPLNTTLGLGVYSYFSARVITRASFNAGPYATTLSIENIAVGSGATFQ